MKKKLLMILFAALLCMSACGNEAGADGTDTAAGGGTEEAKEDAAEEPPLTPVEKLIKDTAGKVELKLWAASDEAACCEELALAFKEEYKDVDLDIKIEAKDIDVLGPVSANDVLPDVFEFSDELLAPLAGEGVLAAVEPAYFLDIAQEDTAGAVRAAGINGETLAYPLSIYSGLLSFYDPSVIDDKTAEHLEDMGKAAEEAGKKVAFELSNAWYLYAFMGAEGSGLYMTLSENGISNKCNWNDEAGVKIADSIEELFKSGGLEAVSSNEQAMEGFAKGRYAAVMSGPWAMEDLGEGVSANVAVAALPSFNAGGETYRMSSFAGYRLLGVNEKSKNREWAKLFAEYLASPVAQYRRYEECGCVPVCRPAEEGTLEGNSLAVALNTQSEYAAPFRAGLNYYAPAGMLGEALAEAAAGSLSSNSVKEVLDKAVEGINSAVTDE